MKAPLTTLWHGATPLSSSPWRRPWLATLLAMLAVGIASAPPRAIAQGAAIADEEEVAEQEEAMDEPADDEESMADEPSADEQPMGELKTVAVAALSGYDALMADVGLLSELGGRPEGAKMVEGMLALFTQGRGLEGLAKDRPIGVVLQTDGSQFVPLACVPVTNLDALMELVTGFGFEPVDAGDGITEIELPDQTVYVKEAGEWAFVAQTAAALAAAPEDPTSVMNELVGKYDLGVRVTVQNVPEMYRTIALEQLRQGMEQGLQQEDDESDEEFAKREAMATAQVEQLSDMIQNLDEVTLGWSLDNERRTTFLDIAFTALPDSLLAKGAQCYKDSKTDFAGFVGTDAAASFQASADTPEELVEQQREQIAAGIDVMRAQANKSIDESEELADDEESRETLKSALTDLIDAYEALAYAGHADLAASLHLGTLGGVSGDLGVVAGGFVPENEKVLSAFKKFAEVAKKRAPELSAPEWDYATHAGVKLSRITLPVPAEGADGVPLPPAMREVLGDTVSVVVGIGEESAYMAAGPAAEEQLKSAIDESAGRQGEACTPVIAEASVRQFLKMVQKVAPDDEGKKVVNMIVDAFKDVPEGKDHLRFTVQPIENGLTVRYEAEEGVLQAIGEGVAAAQKAQQAGGGEF